MQNSFSYQSLATIKLSSLLLAFNDIQKYLPPSDMINDDYNLFSFNIALVERLL